MRVMCVRLFVRRRMRLGVYSVVMAVAGSLIFSARVRGQDGIQGLQQADTMVRSYYATGTNLMYAVGAILGIVGAIRVYQKWSAGHPDTGSTAAAWFGSCVFLVV